MARAQLLKSLLIAVGLLSLGLGIVGIALPVLPTTPFLLLAAACFARSSERLYFWLLSHRWFGPYLRNWREHKAITLRAKVIILISLWFSLGFSTTQVIEAWIPCIILWSIGAIISVLIWSIKTLPPGFDSGRITDPDSIGADIPPPDTTHQE